jgi:UV DNA damage endonuclease
MMLVRFGYVAMSNVVSNASPSKRLTATAFMKLQDTEAALRKLERLGEENINNSLRLLRHNRAHDIHLFRLSSKLVPLVGHECTAGWDCLSPLQPAFKEFGDYAKQHKMRISFHPDHFTVINTPREDVLRTSLADLDFHVGMFEEMGLDERAKLVMHLGGSYGNKEKSRQRYVDAFPLVADRVKPRLTLENDDKTFTALETLEVCEELGLPMVLDIHHHLVNNNGETLEELWPRIANLWVGTDLPPKIHVSSPKNEKDIRSHAEYVDPDHLLPFLHIAKQTSPRLDVMIEAKGKDSALFQLMKELPGKDGIEQVDQASLKIV